MQVIHNDANDWSVLVDNRHGELISGIIDFGDAVHTVLVAEIAIACVYAALGTDDPIGASATILLGFHERYLLMADEIDLIYDLIAMQLVTSVTFAALRHDKALDNSYLTVSETPAWQLLEKKDSMNPRITTAILRKPCGFDAVNGSSAIRRWIAENNKAFAPIVRPAPATMTKALVPYGDASHFMTIASSKQRVKEATQWWDDFCSSNRIELGIGSWGEKRTLYADIAFVSRFIEGNLRDHHLAIDLFMPAGTPLFTPINAIVISVDVERQPLSYGGVIVLEHHTKDCSPFLTIWGYIAHEALERLYVGQQLKAGDLIGFIGDIHENGGWTPHLHLGMPPDVDLTATEILGVGEVAYLDVRQICLQMPRASSAFLLKLSYRAVAIQFRSLMNAKSCFCPIYLFPTPSL